MSEVTNTLNNENAVFNNYDLTKLFIWGNRYDDATFKNNTGAGPTDFAPGTVLGRDSTDNTIVPLDSAVTGNGEDIPIGILAKGISQLADAGTVPNVAFCTGGDVAREKVIFINAGDDFDTVVANRTLEDHLLSQNIRAIESDQLTGTDNA